MQTIDLGRAFRRPEAAGPLPWAFLDSFRSPDADEWTVEHPSFQGTWPSLPQTFAISVRRFGSRPCWTVYEPDRVSLTYTEALARIQDLAAYLASMGVVPGDRVAVCGKNSPEWALAYLAILWADAVVVPIDASLHISEIENLIRASQAKMILCDPDRLPTGIEGLTSLSLEPQPAPGQGPYVYDPALKGRPTLPAPRRHGADLAAILFTSGTTGNPKGVMLTHDNLVSDAYLSQYHMPLYETDVFYALLPIHHSYTMLAVFIEALSVGAEVVFGKKLVVAQILKDLKAAKVTMFLGVPMLFNKLLAGIMKGIRDKGPVVFGLIKTLMAISGGIKKLTGTNPGKRIFRSVLEKASLSHIRICISGGGPLAATTFQAYNQLGLDFVQGYGLTETSPIITLNPVWNYKTTSVGAMVPQADIRVIEPDAQGRGELMVKGPMVMAGYWQNPEETAKIFTPDGYLKTGDVGYVDSENFVFLTGRSKNLIVTEGGKNVFPEEIENAFQLYFDIDQILVRGFLLDAKTRSEGIEVLIFPVRDSFKDEAGTYQHQKAVERMNQIVAEVNQGLHSYQKIQRVTVLEEAMEMTSTKKIKRHTVE